MALISLNNLERFFNNLKTYISNALNSKANTSHTHTKSEITDFPTIPTVNNATLKIQKNGTTVKTFTANASSDVTCNITVPTKTSDLTNDSGFLTSHQDLSGYVPRSGGEVMTGNRISRVDNTWELCMDGGRFYGDGATLTLFGKNTKNSGQEGNFWLTAATAATAADTAECTLIGAPNGTLTWGSKNVAMQEDVVPRSGGAVMTGNALSRTINNDELRLDGGTGWNDGASLSLSGKNRPSTSGYIALHPSNGSQEKEMKLSPDGTWTWEGTACQITSDQRLKQQIAEIDDKLLDAWEDVNPVQFKYNDAVDTKKDKARLHTGYVVQQIDSACKSHGVDISAYGLYCHEEYPERAEEVEVTQEDGTTTKETKVIEEASEHYSLRYTETLVVECAYLRRENKRLNDRLTALEELFKQYIAK